MHKGHWHILFILLYLERMRIGSTQRKAARDVICPSENSQVTARVEDVKISWIEI